MYALARPDSQAQGGDKFTLPMRLASQVLIQTMLIAAHTAFLAELQIKGCMDIEAIDFI